MVKICRVKYCTKNVHLIINKNMERTTYSRIRLTQNFDQCQKYYQKSLQFQKSPHAKLLNYLRCLRMDNYSLLWGFETLEKEGCINNKCDADCKQGVHEDVEFRLTKPVFTQPLQDVSFGM